MSESKESCKFKITPDEDSRQTQDWRKGPGNYLSLDKTCVKLSSIPNMLEGSALPHHGVYGVTTWVSW